MAGNCEYSLENLWPDDLYFLVPASGGTYISAGGQIILLPATFQNWKVRVVKNNTPLDYGAQGLGDPYFTRNISSNTVILNVDAQYQDKFMIQAYKPTFT